MDTSSKTGNTGAQHNLALMYEKGEGVPEDDKEEVKWYRLAAKQVYPHAQYNLGLMYAEGLGVIQDNVYAHMRWNIAASSGDEYAIGNRDIVQHR